MGIKVAKSGRKYRNIPEGYDVETWDKMSVIERMDALHLIDRNYKFKLGKNENNSL